MLEITTRLLGGKLIVKFEAEGVRDVFVKSGELFEVLGGDTACGKCGSENIFPRVRNAQKFQFFELVCGDCQAKLSFGQNKDLTHLWPKRVDEHGNVLDNRGWLKYVAIAPPADAGARSQPARAGSAPPAARTERPPDPPELVEMLKDPTKFDGIINELYYSIQDAYGEADDNRPLTTAAWNKISADKPPEKELIRRLFHFKK